MKTIRYALAIAAVLALAGPVQGQSAQGPSRAIIAAVADPGRPAEDVARDAERRPAQIVAFAGVRPGDRIVELAPGGGYYTRILARSVGPRRARLCGGVAALRAAAGSARPVPGDAERLSERRDRRRRSEVADHGPAGGPGLDDRELSRFPQHPRRRHRRDRSGGVRRASAGRDLLRRGSRRARGPASARPRPCTASTRRRCATSFARSASGSKRNRNCSPIRRTRTAPARTIPRSVAIQTASRCASESRDR